MTVRCPNCDENVQLPDEMDLSFDDPLCDACGSPVPGYRSMYRYCGRCRAAYLKDYDACTRCGYPSATRKERLAGSNSAATGYVFAQPLHSYSFERSTASVKCAYTLVQNASAISDAISEIDRAHILAIDTETSGLDPHVDELILLQIATPERVFIFDVRCLPKDTLKTHLKPILENERVLKILHNANFDYKFIKTNANIRVTPIFDTFLAHNLLSAGTHLPGGLKGIAKLYFDVDLEKSIRLSFKTLTHLEREHLEYAATDAALLFPVFVRQREQLETEQLRTIASVEFNAIQPIAEMELAGLLIDTCKWRNIISKHSAERARLEAEVLQILAAR